MAVWNTVHAATYYFKNFSGPVEDKHSKLIIFVSSMGGYTPMPTVIDYNSSKWGVRGLFWSLRNTERLLGEGKPSFRVNLIAPSWIRTNMTKGFQAAVENRNLNVKIGDVSDCVDVVLRMAADEGVIGILFILIYGRPSLTIV
jgi:5'-hydroxyaverantin dehydrogenase